MTANEIALKLNMQPHPEGGFFKETYRSEITLAKTYLPSSFTANRQLATAIYFLLVDDNFSAFHRIKSDETWHFYLGEPINVVEITADGKLIETKLGTNLAVGEVPQYTVKAGNWFASHVAAWQGYGLVGCTVYPGFDFADFEMADRVILSKQYPEYANLIKTLTR